MNSWGDAPPPPPPPLVERKKHGKGVTISGVGVEREDREKGVKIAQKRGKRVSKSLMIRVEAVHEVIRGNWKGTTE